MNTETVPIINLLTLKILTDVKFPIKRTGHEIGTPSRYDKKKVSAALFTAYIPTFKVIQVYALASLSSNDAVEMYEDISSAFHNTTKSHFSVVMGDFNAKVGVEKISESKFGPHGYGSKNHRGQKLVNFSEKEGLFLINSYYKKQPQKKIWT